MRDALRWTGYAILGCIVALALLFSYFRLRGPTAEQRAAEARLAAFGEPKQGRNAFPVLWYAGYDVPTGEADARLRAEVVDVERRLPSLAVTETLTHRPDAPKLPEADGDRRHLCSSDGVGCLAEAAANRGVLSSALAAFPDAQARETEFERADFYWDPFPADSHLILETHASYVQRVWLGALALRHANGDRDAALAGVCRNVAAWRRMHRGTNSALMGLISAHNADAGLRLFGDMLAQLPHDAAVPAECEAALQPVVAADVDGCAIVANDQTKNDRMWTRAVGDASSAWQRAQNWLLLDRRQTDAWFAEFGAMHCGDAAVARMLRDETLRDDELPRMTRRLECISSAIGCVLSDIASPLEIERERPTLNLAAHLRLAATLLWLRAQPAGTSLTQRFDERPPRLRTGTRASGVDESKHVVFVDDLRPKRPRFELAIATPRP
jgi:hypothetical protein